MQFFIFYKNMHKEILEFICMHTNKTYFLCFWNEKNFEFFKISEKKTHIFNIKFVAYNTSLQPNIKWNSLKKKRIYFYIFKIKNLFFNFLIFFSKFQRKTYIFKTCIG